jgi:uncharacterized membrane protein YczE
MSDCTDTAGDDASENRHGRQSTSPGWWQQAHDEPNTGERAGSNGMSGYCARGVTRGRVASAHVPPASTTSTRAKPYTPSSPTVDWAIRLSRCLAGLAMFGLGISLILEAHLGAAPWDVFHQGVSRKTDISVGNVIIITGLLLLLLWIPLRQKPGVGTLLNALEIGFTVDLIMPLIPDSDRLVVRVVYLAAGIVIIAIGSGFYIGSGLGAGPRDGLMLGLTRLGLTVRTARTAIEVVVLVAGVALGGSIGVGTVAFTFGIGPLVHVFLPPLMLPPRTPAPAVSPAA